MNETFTLETQLLYLVFSACTGTLQHITRKHDDLAHKVKVTFMTYGTGSVTNPFKDKSGAYIFMPDGNAQTYDVKYPKMIVLRGQLASSVYTYYPGIVHVTTIYNVPGENSFTHFHQFVSLNIMIT